jgi:hypothetical protein
LKARYARDQFGLIEKTLDEHEQAVIEKALNYCLTHSLFSAVEFRNAAMYFRDRAEMELKEISKYPNVTVLKTAVEIKIKKDHPDDDPNGRGYHGGPEGIRTLGLCDANAALSQLSHEPTFFTKCSIELIYYTMFHGTCQVQIRKIGPCYFLSFSFRMIKIF